MGYLEVMGKWEELFSRHPQLKLPYIDDTLYYFDNEAATGALNFFQGYLHHVEGRLAGQRFVAEPWQSYVIQMIYGWKRLNGTRKYREVFIFVSRKNGKSFLSVGFALYGLFADNEKGGRVVCAAADRDQARQVYDSARQIVEEDPDLIRYCMTYRHTMSVPSTASNFQVLSADVKTKHGKNLSTVIIDEVHALPNRELIDVLFTGVGAREQPLKIMLTTQTHNKKSACWEFYDYAKKVQQGIKEDPEFFPVLFELSEKDNWKDKKSWYKANPNLDISIPISYLESEFSKALIRPSYENTFKRLHLNMLTEQETRWVPVEEWDACKGEINISTLSNASTWIGIDLSSKVDLSAVLLLFPVKEKILILPFFWMPKDNIDLRKKRDRVDYDVWARQGYITLTEGNVIDYEVIEKKFLELAGIFNIKEIGFDPWNAQQLMTKLETNGLEVVQIPQTFSHLSNATKELEAWILSRRIVHDGNPVLRWMFSNVAIMEDGNGNIKINKKKCTEKIDGISALINGINRMLAVKEEKPSRYASEGIRTFG